MKPIIDATILYYGFWGAVMLAGMYMWWRLDSWLASIDARLESMETKQ